MAQTQGLRALKEKARELRLEVLDVTTSVASGTSRVSYSCVEILVALYFGGILRYRSDQPHWPERDRFILSKGHAAPIFYTVLAHAGLLRPPGTVWPAHHRPPGGGPSGSRTSARHRNHLCSLGKGISVGLGHVLGGRLNKLDYHVYVLLGDGECQEGQIWESAMSASHFKANNLTAIVDYNKYQESGPVSRELELEPFAGKWRAFGWHVEEVDGHDIGPSSRRSRPSGR